MILFKDVKRNYSVYILDRENLEVKVGKVTENTLPHLEPMSMPSSIGMSSSPQMVVDLSIEVDGKSATYTIPDSLSITYTKNIAISTDREGLIPEVEAMKNKAEEILNSVEKQKEIVKKSTALLSELNPTFKKERETEERFSQIEGSVNDIKSTIGNLETMMSKMMQEMGVKK